MRHANFWFVPYRSRDNFPKNDDLFPIGAFPIGAKDCTMISGNFLKSKKVGKRKKKLKNQLKWLEFSEIIVDPYNLPHHPLTCRLFWTRKNKLWEDVL